MTYGRFMVQDPLYTEVHYRVYDHVADCELMRQAAALVAELGPQCLEDLGTSANTSGKNSESPDETSSKRQR